MKFPTIISTSLHVSTSLSLYLFPSPVCIQVAFPPLWRQRAPWQTAAPLHWTHFLCARLTSWKTAATLELNWRSLIERCWSSRLQPWYSQEQTQHCLSVGEISAPTLYSMESETKKTQYNRTFVWWRHLTTTTRMHFAAIFVMQICVTHQRLFTKEKYWIQQFASKHSGSCSEMTSSITTSLVLRTNCFATVPRYDDILHYLLLTSYLLTLFTSYC